MNKEEGKKDTGTMIAKGLAALVYIGVVIVVTIMFISFVLTAFDEGRYFTLAIMTVGGLLVGASSIAFPIALHEWATDGVHRSAGITLYVLEILFISMNTMVSFTVLRASQGDFNVPAWMNQYEPYSVLSIVFVLAAWGIMFMLDPAHEVKRDKKKLEKEKEAAAFELENQRAQNEIKKEQLIAEQETAFLSSIEGEDFIAEEATKNIAEQMAKRSNARGKRHFGSKNTLPSMAADTKREELKN